MCPHITPERIAGGVGMWAEPAGDVPAAGGARGQGGPRLGACACLLLGETGALAMAPARAALALHPHDLLVVLILIVGAAPAAEAREALFLLVVIVVQTRHAATVGDLAVLRTKATWEARTALSGTLRTPTGIAAAGPQ